MKKLKQLIEIKEISKKDDNFERKYENWRY